MLRKTSFLVVLFILLFTLVSVAEEYDFRNINWGMSIEEVKNNEELELVYETENSLMYETMLNSNDFYLVYFFDDSKLTQGVYSLKETFYNNLKYVRCYEKLKENLTEKYGEPIKDEELWLDDYYKGNYSKYGDAVLIGDLFYTTVWENEGTQILLGLLAKSGEITLPIYYSNIAEVDNILEESKQEDLDQL